jgi:hypothetical protein
MLKEFPQFRSLLLLIAVQCRSNASLVHKLLAFVSMFQNVKFLFSITRISLFQSIVFPLTIKRVSLCFQMSRVL